MADRETSFYKIVGENIKKYRTMRNYSLQVLGEMIGVKKKTVQRYERGEIRTDMNRLEAIAEALQIDITKLLAGTVAGTMLEMHSPPIVQIPLVSFVPVAGPILTEANVEEYLPLPRMLIRNDKDFCLRVRGESMEDVGINDGDLVLVHPQSVAENGQTIIARTNGEVTCKRFYKMNGKCRLEPPNKHYKPIDYKDLEIIGIITKIIKDIF